MSLLGSLSKGFLIYTCIIWILVIIEFFVMGQPFLAVPMITVLIIPFSMMLYEYFKSKKNMQSEKLI